MERERRERARERERETRGNIPSFELSFPARSNQEISKQQRCLKAHSAHSTRVGAIISHSLGIHQAVVDISDCFVTDGAGAGDSREYDEGHAMHYNRINKLKLKLLFCK